MGPVCQQRVQEDACCYGHIQRLYARDQSPGRWDGQEGLTLWEQFSRHTLPLTTHYQQCRLGHLEISAASDHGWMVRCLGSHGANHMPTLWHFRLQHFFKAFVSINVNDLHGTWTSLADYRCQWTAIVETGGHSVHAKKICRAQNRSKVHGILNSIQHKPKGDQTTSIDRCSAGRLLCKITQWAGLKTHSLMNTPSRNPVQMFLADSFDLHPTSVGLLADLYDRGPVRHIALFH